MAELFGIFAGGMNVVSLAIQVAESIKKLKGFCDLMKAAPEEIRLAIDKVEILSLILEDVYRDMQQQLFLDPRTRATVARSYRLCRNSSEALRALVADLDLHLVKRKKRGSFKIAMKQDKIESFRKKLESAKATMYLANQCYDRAVQGQNWESHERDMLEIRYTVSRMSSMAMMDAPSDDHNDKRDVDDRISEIQEGPGNMASTEPSFQSCSRRLGRKKTIKQQYTRLMGFVDVVTYDQGDTTSTSLSITLPRWIYARNFQVHLTKSYQGWDQSFRTYRTVSYDAQVFRYSMADDIKGLQQRFASGRASPFEVDPEGRMPLHYAALYTRPNACRFLLENGADANVRNSWQAEPLQPNHYKERGNSTPLLLAMSPVPLKRLDTNRHYSVGTINKNFEDTIQVLYTMGNSDPFHKDEFGDTAFHKFTGPVSVFHWLRRQEQIELASLFPKEKYDLVAYQL